VFQFFVIEKAVEPCGYDNCCTLHHSSLLDTIVKSCVGNPNHLLHMKKCHGLCLKAKDKQQKMTNKLFFGSRKAPFILFDTASDLIIIMRDLCPFAITDGLGFAKYA
jgi:hypothetical protein